jgi:hypothetical protein
MVRIGDWSYSIYLWHWPLIVFAKNSLPTDAEWWLPVVALASLAPALASYHWVEQPIRNLAGLARRQWIVLVCGVVATPILMALAVTFAVQQGFWSEQVQQLQAATLPPHIGSSQGCAESKPLRDDANCIWTPQGSGRPSYVRGDSHADHFTETFVEAGRSLNRQVVIAATNGCPIVDAVFLDLRPEARGNPACARYVQDSVEFLGQAEPGTVVISNAHYYWNSPIYSLGATPDDVSNETSRKMESYRQGLMDTFSGIQDSGHQVALIQSAPTWGTGWDPDMCSTIAILSGK